MSKNNSWLIRHAANAGVEWGIDIVSPKRAASDRASTIRKIFFYFKKNPDWAR
ncbi:hypothetical protein [Azohydromonas lata]|uniref:Uncharacterized protein n=1 Tax=Azohydromonas lata TaxID=45677 RepID=A0ABU5IKS7_9BURK|nr:hypothetical protein [Azohydromonas lata]MDZ5459503.1 hypothetical protein [Azohydromonas lata]